jgi:ribosome-associated toxin RatA of RatAB toxin-antitoxin module
LFGSAGKIPIEIKRGPFKSLRNRFVHKFVRECRGNIDFHINLNRSSGKIPIEIKRGPFESLRERIVHKFVRESGKNSDWLIILPRSPK